MTLLYERLLRPLLFRLEPERVHDLAILAGRLLDALPPARWLLGLAYRYRDRRLWQDVAGITFENPVGLAAGFDKECRLMRLMGSVGFGFVEVGSVTAEPYGGNPGPRAVRLVADRSIIVNYGLKNEGAAVAKRRLRQAAPIPVGVSVAKTNKEFPDEEAQLRDWIAVLRQLKDAGDYLTINLSCPNTWDPTNYCEPARLAELLARIRKERLRFGRPVFLKLGPDLSDAHADDIIALCRKERWIAGFILSNLVKERKGLRLRSEGHRRYKGGLSGTVARPKALRLVKRFRERCGDRFVLIACGGIFTAEDAYEYITAGASLVQLLTGMIYRGPGTIKEVNKGLVRLLERDGFASIGEAVGAAAHQKQR